MTARARARRAATATAGRVSLPELLDGHVGLDVACLDRIYLNGYVPNLQVGGQVVTFLTEHLGYPVRLHGCCAVEVDSSVGGSGQDRCP